MCHRPECILIPRCQTQYGGRLDQNSDWEDDNDLNNDLAKFVSLNLKRIEILDFLRKDYPMYAWSLRSLARRMQYFGIQFTDYDVEVLKLMWKQQQKRDFRSRETAWESKCILVYGTSRPQAFFLYNYYFFIVFIVFIFYYVTHRPYSFILLFLFCYGTHRPYSLISFS